MQNKDQVVHRVYILFRKKTNYLEYAGLRLIHESFSSYAAHGIAAWDWGRQIMLHRWGALIGFYADQEAWKLIMDIARKRHGLLIIAGTNMVNIIS